MPNFIFFSRKMMVKIKRSNQRNWNNDNKTNSNSKETKQNDEYIYCEQKSK